MLRGRDEYNNVVSVVECQIAFGRIFKMEVSDTDGSSKVKNSRTMPITTNVMQMHWLLNHRPVSWPAFCIRSGQGLKTCGTAGAANLWHKGITGQLKIWIPPRISAIAWFSGQDHSNKPPRLDMVHFVRKLIDRIGSISLWRTEYEFFPHLCW